jgi:hypothetical protein
MLPAPRKRIEGGGRINVAESVKRRVGFVRVRREREDEVVVRKRFMFEYIYAESWRKWGKRLCVRGGRGAG